jgi:prophage antirepressor-like protein
MLALDMIHIPSAIALCGTDVVDLLGLEKPKKPIRKRKSKAIAKTSLQNNTK